MPRSTLATRRDLPPYLSPFRLSSVSAVTVRPSDSTIIRFYLFRQQPWPQILLECLDNADAQVLAGDQASSVIHGTALSYEENDDIMRLRFSGGELWVPGRAAADGAELRLRIRASDVSLCRIKPEQSTILNILPEVVESIRDDSSPAALVRVLLGEASILSRVTRRSVRELNLQRGDEVFAQIKSVAVRPSIT